MSADGERGEKRPKKSDTLQIRIPHATKEEFLDACESDGESASEVLRRSILDYLMRHKRPAGKPRQDLVLVLPAFLRRRRIAIGATIAAAIGVMAVMPSAASPDLRAVFNRLDANRDGQLTPDEYFTTDGDMPWTITADAVVYRFDTEQSIFLDYYDLDGNGQDKGIEIHNAPPPPNPGPLSPGLDTNGDGQVQFSEYEAQQLREMKSRFAKLDRDGNGMLNADELTLRPMDFSGVRSAVTVTADGRVTMGLPSPPKPGEKSPVAKADANKDGIVTLDEFLASRR